MRFIIRSLILFLALSSFHIHAQILDPVDWEYQIIKTGENAYELVFIADMDEGWTIYSQFLSSDEGPIPTGFYFEDKGGASLSDKTEECGDKKEAYDNFFEMQLVKFSKHAAFINSINVEGDTKIKGYLEFMTCDDTKCLPPKTEDFSFNTAEAVIAAEVGYDRKKLCDGSWELPVSTGMNETMDMPEENIEDDTEESSGIEFGSIGSVDDEPQAEEEEQEGILKPVKWSFETEQLQDDTYALKMIAMIDEGWHIYSMNLKSDDGPIATNFSLEETNGVELVGDIEESGKKMITEYDEVFEMELTKLKKEAYYTQKVKVEDAEKSLVKGWLQFMVCDNSRCLAPEYVDFQFNPGSASSSTAESGSAYNTETVGEGTPVFFEFDYSNAEHTCLDEEDLEEEDKTSMWWIFIAGFLGGMVALLTPCVFPMIPLTVSFFTKSSTNRSSGIKNASIYGLSIIVIYVLLGLLITGIFGADALNLLSTNAWFNIFFFLLFVVFAMSFFGLFEITLPSSWANSTDRAADRGGLLGIFFMAFTLSLVSFSCTGPIIGTLLVEAATGTGGPIIMGRIPVGPLVGMFGFSLALALPFALFAAFPGWLNSLPKSGGWMNSVKVTLGFVEIALALKFLSVADLTMGWKILPYELFVGLWVLCALGLALYYFKIIRFPLDSPIKKIGTPRMVLGVASLALAVYLGFGFKYSDQAETFATPNLLSGLAPPAGHSYIYPKKCPLNLNCFKDFDEGRKFAEKVNKPILLDFTGHGCVNCRRMEDNVWSQEGVYELIRDKYVLISLYVDERKALDSTYVSKFSGKTMRSVGNKWSDFQAIHFNRNSQPYYVLMSDDGVVLNEPVAYTPDKDVYQEFLECGVEKYNELCGNCLSEK